MMPFLTIDEIETIARGNQKQAVLLMFAAYSGEKSGPIYEVLSRAREYNAHSGKKTDVMCAGYSDIQRNESEFGQALKFKTAKDSPLQYYYPDAFHSVRDFVAQSLMHGWNYDGGVDLLLFAASKDSKKPIIWNWAAMVRSHDLVPGIFADVDQMIRAVINLNEQHRGRLMPEELDPTIARKKFAAVLKSLGGKVAGNALSSALSFIPH
jgi:hypothetical protein